jgi:nitrite reductase (NADH) small subunit
MARVHVGNAADVPPGGGCVVEADGRVLALFNVRGQYYAIDNSCPHRGGPLAEGDLADAVVACPWHGWRWDVTTGGNVNNPAIAVACFPVTVGPDGIFVDLP